MYLVYSQAVIQMEIFSLFAMINGKLSMWSGELSKTRHALAL